ncbi:MAG: hypothetical protein ACLS28_18395 [Clostridium neonatale]
MAKGKRKTIILNEDNPKEKIILELLEKQYNASEFIKDILYDYIQKDNSNNLRDDNIMTNVLSMNGNTIINELPHNDNIMTTELSNDDNCNFLIDINNVSEKDADINAASDFENPSDNAINFLKNSF